MLRSSARGLLLASVAFSCGTTYRTLPDGGRERVDCKLDESSLGVKVVDANGAAVEGATVTAVNAGTGQQTSGTTNGAGATHSVDGTLGAGTAVVTASKGQQKSDPVSVQFTCGECGCSVQPASVVITLHD